MTCLLGILLTGCEKPTSIQGRVTLNGEPVKQGTISFRPTDGKGPSTGGVIADGEYSVPKASVGSKVVLLTAIDPDKVTTSRAATDKLIQEARAKGIPPHIAVRADLIPPNAKGNNQVVEIQEGSQTLDFAVSTKE